MKTWGARQQDFATVGRSVFIFLVCAQLILAMLLCPAIAGTAIASERRRGKLALLTLSSVRPAHIVLGKFLACISVVGVTMAGTLPLLVMTTFYGGVSGKQVLVAIPCLTAIVVASTGLGLLFSSIRRKEGEAIGLTLVAVALWVWVLPTLMHWKFQSHALTSISPWYCCLAGMRIGANLGQGLTASLSVAGGITLLSLVLASRAIARPAIPPRPRLQWSRRLRLRHARRPPLCGRLFWTTSGLSRASSALGVRIYHAMLACLVVVAFVAYWHETDDTLTSCVVLSWITCAIAGLAGVAASARWFHEQKADGTLAVLLTTPIVEADLVLSYLLGALWLLMPALLALECSVFLSGLREMGSYPSAPSWGDFVSGSLVLWVILIPTFAFYTLFGLLMSAYCKTALAALSAAAMFVVGSVVALLSCAALTTEGVPVLVFVFGPLGFCMMFAAIVENLRRWLHRV